MPGVRPLSLPPSVFFGVLNRADKVQRIADGKGYTDSEILSRTLRDDYLL